MSLNYARELLKISLSEICSSIGFDRTSEMAMDMLVDVCERQFQYLIQQIFPNEQCDYLQVLFILLKNSSDNLDHYQEFIRQFQSMKFANEIIQFPHRKKQQFHLRIPHKDSPQILQRDLNPSTEYIYDWLPLFPDRMFSLIINQSFDFFSFRRNTG